MLSRARALGLIGGAAAAAIPGIAQAQTTATVRIGASATDLYLEPYIALDQGFFARAGIDAQITPLANGAAIAQAVAGGSLDTGLADMIQIANAAAHGLPFAFYAGSGLYSTQAPILAMCVANASPVKSPKDLDGGTVALVALKSITEAAVEEWLRLGGADLTTIKLYELPYAQMLPALQRGTVAAALIGEPFLSAAKDDVRIIGKAYDAVGPSFYISAWFASRDWLARNAGLARRLARVFYETARWANAHHAGTAPILAKYAKLDLERIRSMNRTQYATSLDPKLMQPVIDIAVRYKLIERPVSAADLIVRVA